MTRSCLAVRCLSLAALLACAGAGLSAEAKPRGRKVALLVGVSGYDRSERFPDLKYTENDVEKLAVLQASFL